MKTKRRRGDRFDATLIRDLDSMHFFMPKVLPNRCDNEAYLSEQIDLTNLEAFLEKKNASQPEYKYNLFQCIVTAMLKTVYLRPKMNRFIANQELYQRNDVTAAFVVKKQFSDHAGEALAKVNALPEDTLETVHQAIWKQIRLTRSETEKDSTTDSMDKISQWPIPRSWMRAFIRMIRALDQHGRVPRSLVESEIFYSSAVISNLGSIGLHAGYHHLTTGGTASVFVVIGEKKKRPYYDDDGTVTMKMSVDLGITVDERIADGYYYAGTIRLLRKLLEEPELLERPMNEEVAF